jgi:hopanoid biosynthesis associated radical SAM protein HpnH
MSVPVSQMLTVAAYVLKQRLRGRKRYPLVLMLEPLFRCNLACAGCGKIQHPSHILRRHLAPEACFQAVEECGAPIVSLPGGEPLLHPQIDTIVEGLVARRKFVYLCTNALKLAESLDRFRPSKYLSFSVHIDGLREEHDRAVCRDGVFDAAVDAIRAALRQGFRVTTNTTLYAGVNTQRVRALFDRLMDLGVEAMMISPGYPYAKAPDQAHFLSRQQTVNLFREVLDRPRRRWRFNHSPLFLEFLKGRIPLECTPWGSPTFNLLGWQRPCYLLDEGYASTFQQLMDETDWDAYGRASGNAKCQDCMVHCGYEPSAMSATFGSARGLVAAARHYVM